MRNWINTKKMVVAAAMATGLTFVGEGAATAATLTSRLSAPSSLTVAFSLTPFSLNPLVAGKVSDQDIVHLIGGNLFELRGNAQGSLSPGLADSYTTSDGGLAVTIRLRPNLKFSNGTPLTSADVAANLEWGIHDAANGFPNFYAPIKSVTTDGPLTVMVTFSHPYPDFQYLLAYSNFAIVPAADVNPKTGSNVASLNDDPISAGPYMLKSPWTGGSVTIVRNPYYWGPQPVVQTIHFVTIPDASARIDELRSGQVDLIDAVPPTLVPELRGLGLTASDATSYGDILMDTDVDVPGLNNVNVRRAISLAIDRNEISKIAFDGLLPGQAGFWPPDMPGFDPHLSTSANDVEARKLLADSPCANDKCTFTLESSTAIQPFDAQIVPILEANLSAVGINVTPDAVDGVTEDKDVFTPAGTYQLALTQTFDNGDIPDGILSYMLSSNGRGPVLGAEASRWKSAAMDNLITQADESTGAARTAALNAITALFVKEQPWVPLVPFTNPVASRVPSNVAWFDHGLFVEIGRQ